MVRIPLGTLYAGAACSQPVFDQSLFSKGIPDHRLGFLISVRNYRWASILGEGFGHFVIRGMGKRSVRSLGFLSQRRPPTDFPFASA